MQSVNDSSSIQPLRIFPLVGKVAHVNYLLVTGKSSKDLNVLAYQNIWKNSDCDNKALMPVFKGYNIESATCQI